jgi:signal transduction histidine kinase
MAPASRFLRRMALVAALFVAMGTLLAAIIGVRITTPIRELAQAADAITAGDVSRRVAISRSDEIGRLADAFNAMVDIRLKSLAVEEENRRVLETTRLKSEFVANMSHELRTPLNVIIGFAELMHHGKVGPVSQRHKEYLADILSSSTHLLRLIDDVLDLAKVESGTMELHSEPVDLQQLAATVRDMLRELAAAKQLRIDTVVDADASGVVVDHARLTQILYNYLSNAIKFTPAGGRVGVRVASAGPSFVRIDVDDTGPGIAADDLGKLFVEFQQLDSGMGKGHQGTGLGLALSKKLAEAMGGRVEVSSTPGSGSTFSVVIPRSPVATQGGSDAVHR